jgi:hypothetical protein
MILECFENSGRLSFGEPRVGPLFWHGSISIMIPVEKISQVIFMISQSSL